MKKLTMLVSVLLAFYLVVAISKQCIGSIGSGIFIQTVTGNLNLQNHSKEKMNHCKLSYDNDSVKYINPVIVINPMELEETHPNPPMITTQTITVTNAGDGILNWDLTVDIDPELKRPCDPDSLEALITLNARMQGEGLGLKGDDKVAGLTFGPIKHTDVDYDLQFEYPCGDASGEAGAESDGNYIYTTKWNGPSFFKYGLDGTFLGSFQVGSVNGIRDLAFDGTYMYGGSAAATVYQMDFNTHTLVSTITAATATRAIAYDEVEDGFWSNNWSTPIVLWDRNGAMLNTIITAGNESYYGFAYDPQGPYLWGYSQKAGTSANMLYKMDLPVGTIVEEFDMLTILSLPTLGNDLAGGLYFQPDLIQGTNTLGGIVQNICIWGVEMGLSVPVPAIDVGVTAFISPVSGSFLGNESVTIRVKNYGATSVSNIPVSYTIDGSTAVTDLLSGTITPNSFANFTFPGTVNLSNQGQTYIFEGCTALASDENPGNDCKTANITNIIPTYCDASNQVEDEYIANVLCGEINNSSGWQGGVADYTSISTTIPAGSYEEITVTNGNAWSSDIVYCWVDWDVDFEFEGGNELYILTNMAGIGEIFKGTILVPTYMPEGQYRLRIRMTYETAPQPCGEATYGEVEDYSINVGSGPGPWLSAELLTGTLEPGQSTDITVTFNSFLVPPTGTYSGLLTFTSNDPGNPVVDVPVILTCISTSAIIGVQPDEFHFYMMEIPIQTQTLTISNSGITPLNCDMSITYWTQNPILPYFDMNEYRNNPSLAYLNNESAPPSPPGNFGSVTDAMWDLQFSAPCGDGNGEAGIETDGNYIYTTKWNGVGFFKYEMDGTYIGPMTVGTVQGIRDLTFDGTYFYGGTAATTVYKMDFSTQTLIGQFTAPTAVRAIAYDYDEDAFYANNWSTPIVLFDASGATLHTLPTAGDESYYGFAYDNNDGNKYLYGFSQKLGLSGGVIFELALPNGTPTGVSHDVVSELANPGTDLAGGLFICDNWFVNETTSIGGLVQNVVLFAYELHETQYIPDELLSLSDYQVTVNPGESVDIDVTCNAYYGGGIGMVAKIWIANNSVNNPLVEIPVQIWLPDAIEEQEGEIVLLFPNPSSSKVEIKSPHEISLVRIINQSGQMVHFENVSGTEATINTSGLPPGNYIVEITTERGISTQKLILK